MGQYADAWRDVHNFLNSEWMYSIQLMRDTLARAKEAEAFVEGAVGEIERRKADLTNDVMALTDRMARLREEEAALERKAEQAKADLERELDTYGVTQRRLIKAAAEAERLVLVQENTERQAEVATLRRQVNDLQAQVVHEQEYLATVQREVEAEKAQLARERAARDEFLATVGRA